MNYQPPFTITSEIIDLVSQISEKIGEVQRDFSNASPQLRKQNRIKTITGILQAEGKLQCVGSYKAGHWQVL